MRALVFRRSSRTSATWSSRSATAWRYVSSSNACSVGANWLAPAVRIAEANRISLSARAVRTARSIVSFALETCSNASHSSLFMVVSLWVSGSDVRVPGRVLEGDRVDLLRGVLQRPRQQVRVVRRQLLGACLLVLASRREAEGLTHGSLRQRVEVRLTEARLLDRTAASFSKH